MGTRPGARSAVVVCTVDVRRKAVAAAGAVGRGRRLVGPLGVSRLRGRGRERRLATARRRRRNNREEERRKRSRSRRCLGKKTQSNEEAEGGLDESPSEYSDANSLMSPSCCIFGTSGEMREIVMLRRAENEWVDIGGRAMPLEARRGITGSRPCGRSGPRSQDGRMVHAARQMRG